VYIAQQRKSGLNIKQAVVNFLLPNLSARIPAGICVKIVVRPNPIEINKPTSMVETLNLSVKYIGVIELTVPIPKPVKKLKRKNNDA